MPVFEGDDIEIDPSSDSFPLGLKENFPFRIPTLYARGNLDLLNTPMVAIVGSRSASREGLVDAGKLALLLALEGYTVVSGLARGIDTVALSSAMAAKGKVVAVIGTPIDKVYPPENAELQHKISTDHLLLSHCTTNYRPCNFTERNAIIAKLSGCTVAIEVKALSGTVNMVRQALKFDRRVLALKIRKNWTDKWFSDFTSQNALVFETAEETLQKIKQIIPKVPS